MLLLRHFWLPKFYFWKGDWGTGLFLPDRSVNSETSFIQCFCTWYQVPLYLWWIEPILKSWRVSYFVYDCSCDSLGLSFAVMITNSGGVFRTLSNGAFCEKKLTAFSRYLFLQRALSYMFDSAHLKSNILSLLISSITNINIQIHL